MPDLGRQLRHLNARASALPPRYRVTAGLSILAVLGLGVIALEVHGGRPATHEVRSVPLPGSATSNVPPATPSTVPPEFDQLPNAAETLAAGPMPRAPGPPTAPAQSVAVAPAALTTSPPVSPASGPVFDAPPPGFNRGTQAQPGPSQPSIVSAPSAPSVQPQLPLPVAPVAPVVVRPTPPAKPVIPPARH